MAQKAWRAVKLQARRATRGLTFDTGMLIALERRKAGALAILRACRFSHARITIPAAVIAQWWRGTHRSILEIGVLEPITPALAILAGELLSKTKGSNAVDAMVVASASVRADLIITSDPDDLLLLAHHVKNVEIATFG